MAYSKKGFTVIELMIAMSVFAVAIVLIMAGVIYIGRQYQQSSNRVALEDASRTVHRQIINTIQFTKNDMPEEPVNGTWKAFCLGNDMYVYGSNYIANPGDHSTQPDGLFYKPNNNNCDSGAPTVVNGVNLLPDGAKVAHFSWNSATNTLTTVFVKTPGEDLLKLDGNSENTVCNAVPGREYCSFVKLVSTAVGRL